MLLAQFHWDKKKTGCCLLLLSKEEIFFLNLLEAIVVSRTIKNSCQSSVIKIKIHSY